MKSKKLSNLDKKITDWDRWFLGLAKKAASRSKDPSTKVGAVLASKKNRFISLGYNGFARKCCDNPKIYANRSRKYLRTIHAEINAILFAKKKLKKATLYTWPFQPCAPCMAIVIQKGIRRVVTIRPTPEIEERWRESITEAQEMAREVGCEIIFLEGDL